MRVCKITSVELAGTWPPRCGSEYRRRCTWLLTALNPQMGEKLGPGDFTHSPHCPVEADERPFLLYYYLPAAHFHGTYKKTYTPFQDTEDFRTLGFQDIGTGTERELARACKVWTASDSKEDEILPHSHWRRRPRIGPVAHLAWCWRLTEQSREKAPFEDTFSEFQVIQESTTAGSIGS